MKQFDDIEMTSEDVEPVAYDKYALQKQRLIFNVTREPKVCDALLRWLMSFQGGMSKEAFTSQIMKLSPQTSQAIEQIEKSLGKRSICKIKSTEKPYPPVGDIIQYLASGNIFIAVNGQERPLKTFIRNTYQTLKDLGRTYVLDMNELRLKWVDKYNQGESSVILRSAMDSEFLIVIGFEAPLHLESWIGDWFGSLRRYRVEKKMPIIMSFARFMEKTHTLQYFKLYSV